MATGPLAWLPRCGSATWDQSVVPDRVTDRMLSWKGLTACWLCRRWWSSAHFCECSCLHSGSLGCQLLYSAHAEVGRGQHPPGEAASSCFLSHHHRPSTNEASLSCKKCSEQDWLHGLQLIIQRLKLLWLSLPKASMPFPTWKNTQNWQKCITDSLQRNRGFNSYITWACLSHRHKYPWGREAWGKIYLKC